MLSADERVDRVEVEVEVEVEVVDDVEKSLEVDPARAYVVDWSVVLARKVSRGGRLTEEVER